MDASPDAAAESDARADAPSDIVADAALDADAAPDAAALVAQVVDEVHEAACRREVTCGLQAALADCLSSTMPPISTLTTQDLGLGRIVVDARAGHDLAAFLANLPCGQTGSMNRVARQTFDGLCATTFRGQVPLGATCAADSECATGLFCSYVPPNGIPSEIGHCAPSPPPAQIGDFCYNGCEPAAVCDRVNHPDNPLCEPAPSAMGAPCVEDQQGCNGGLLCLYRTCGVLPTTGEPCDETNVDEQCDDPREICDQTVWTCVPRLVLGAKCAGNPDACLPYLWCDPTASGTCQPRRGAGQDCSGDQRCLGDLGCDSGACVPNPGFRNVLLVCP
ncbi:MAG TPA: hypothetical protein VHJ20_19705 [Polyangia bacterium]|nr:hypothetical protein [Polyangia bacterium]